MISIGLISSSEKIIIFLAECKSLWSSPPSQFFPHDLNILPSRHWHLTISISPRKKGDQKLWRVTLVEVQMKRLYPSNSKRKEQENLSWLTNMALTWLLRSRMTEVLWSPRFYLKYWITQAYGTVQNLWMVGCWTQDFMHARPSDYQLKYIFSPRFSFFFFFIQKLIHEEWKTAPSTWILNRLKRSCSNTNTKIQCKIQKQLHFLPPHWFPIQHSILLPAPRNNHSLSKKV